MDEAHYVEELAFLPFTDSASITAHCMCILGGRSIIFVGAGSKLWLLIGEAERRGREQISSPIFLSRDLNVVIGQSSDDRVLCLWSLPVDFWIQHPGCESSSGEDAHPGGVPLVTIAFGRPFGEQNQPCSLLNFDANQLISDALSLPRSDHASKSQPLAAASDTLLLQVAPILLRCYRRNTLRAMREHIVHCGAVPPSLPVMSARRRQQKS
jgi:hypothetical protein